MADVLLVVEVGDSSLQEDLGFMADLYAAAGVPYYWVVARTGVFVHSEPSDAGYVQRILHADGGIIAPGTTRPIAVADVTAEV
jgi:Uma2 family endonuclease